jgi:erythromycin esterase
MLYRLLAVVVCTGPCLAQDVDRVAWLQANAVPIRTIDPDDDDFADLLPLIEKIGDARVVALGEQSHGDGAAFVAKDRLVRFLHQRMGFDVLIWESGMFDCREMDAALRSNQPLDKALEKGIFPIWTRSGHVTPVLEYARSTHATATPLEQAGFDCQFSSRASAGFGDSIAAFFSRLDPPFGDADGSPLGAVRWMVRQLDHEEPGGTQEEVKSRREAVKALIDAIDSRGGELGRVHSAREMAFTKRVLENLLVYDDVRREPGGAAAADTNLRDRRMGENLVWLAQEIYPDRKMIVWAASFHLMREAATIDTGERDLNYANVVPMGQVAFDALGDDYYSVMFTASRGSAGNPFFGARELDPAAEDSLESDFDAAGFAYAFLDWSDGEAGWLAGPVNARPLGYSPMTADWTKCFDAVFYTREMFPSTSDGGVPAGVRTAKPRVLDPQTAALAALLDDLRKAMVCYGLGFSAVVAHAPPGYDAQRLEHFPTADAWPPEVLGHVEPLARRYRTVAQDGSGYPGPADASGGYVMSEPLASTLTGGEGSLALAFLGGVAPEGMVTLNGYATVLCRGPMAGRVLLNSYATALIDGDLTGTLTSTSYFNSVINGKVTGSIDLEVCAMVYVLGGFEGTARLGDRAKLWIAGRTPAAALESISGTGLVFLEDSDLPPGTTMREGLTVVVGAAKPKEDH